MRIALFTPTFLPKCSGAEIFHHNLASQFVALGHQPVVVLPRSLLRRLHNEAWQLPYETVPFPANIWSYFKYSVPIALWLNRRILARLQRHHRFDVWHTAVLSPSGVCFANWQSHCGVPGLVRAVGDDVQSVEGSTQSPHMTPLIRRWIPRTQRVVSLSEEMSRALASLGVLPSRIELIPNAVDEARFSQACDWAQLRASLGLPAEAFLFLCVARNHPQKDLPTLLSAFKKLTTDLPEKPLHLVLVGRGVPALRPSLQTSGLESQVTLLEFQADSTARGIPQFPPQPLVDLYRAADAFVLSSVLEGFSSALLEAMAAGLPVIATAVPGIVDRLKHGKNGLLCQPRDPGALAKLMRLVCEDAPLASDLAANGRKSSLSHSWSATAQAYLNLYERMILERATKHPPHPTR